MELEGKVKCLESEVKELKILVEELRTDIVKKETRLDHLQKKSDELSSSMSKAKDDVVKEFKSSSVYTRLLDKTYAASFKDFRLDTREAFLGVDFDSIKLPMVGETSILPSIVEDINTNDNATTFDKPKDDAQPMDAAQPKDDAPTGLSRQFLYFVISNLFLFFFFDIYIFLIWGPLFWTVFNLLKYIHFIHGFQT